MDDHIVDSHIVDSHIVDSHIVDKQLAESQMIENARWVLASGNHGKIAEFQRLFSHSGIEILAQSELNVEEAEETGLSFIENAILKARNASAQTGLPAIADDSGLEVTALKGEPGIYSARYSRDIAGDNCNDKTNNRKLLDKLADVSDRSARFVCSLAFIRHAKDPNPVISIAQWQGSILREERGEQGFGYDPLFFLDEQQLSSAELDPAVKNTISHRAKAMQQLFEQMKQQAIV